MVFQHVTIQHASDEREVFTFQFMEVRDEPTLVLRTYAVQRRNKRGRWERIKGMSAGPFEAKSIADVFPKGLPANIGAEAKAQFALRIKVG